MLPLLLVWMLARQFWPCGLPSFSLFLVPPSSAWSVWTEKMRTVSLSPQLPLGSLPNWNGLGLFGSKLETLSCIFSSCICLTLASCFVTSPALFLSHRIYLSYCHNLLCKQLVSQFHVRSLDLGRPTEYTTVFLFTALPNFTFSSYYTLTLGAAQYNHLLLLLATGSCQVETS